MGDTVHLYIDRATGDLTCRPTVLHAARNQSINFISEKLPFSIMSKGISPLDTAEIWSDGKASALATVREDANPGEYLFACAVYDPESGRIYLDAGCPSIIIGPRGT
jgi:hypothetical protein